MREICTSGSEGGAGQSNAPSLPLSLFLWRFRRLGFGALGGLLVTLGCPDFVPSVPSAVPFFPCPENFFSQCP